MAIASDNYTITFYPNSPLGGIVDNSPFRHHAPKPEGVKGLKLTKDNLERAAEYIRKTLNPSSWGDPVGVTTSNEWIAIGDLQHSPVDNRFTGASGGLFMVGQWVLEEFDYQNNVPKFRRATISDREKHDLR